ncbi:MAG: hypothetical protein Q8S57_11015 [Methanoregula sp.]|nr:hypothetical protein [Methanoregula sp.]
MLLKSKLLKIIHYQLIDNPKFKIFSHCFIEIQYFSKTNFMNEFFQIHFFLILRGLVDFFKFIFCECLYSDEERLKSESIQCFTMPKTHKRKYEKIDDAEIDLVVQCNDSHEFYERYRQVFPTKKKGIDSISKIWKRRSEFLKKQQPADEPLESAINSSHELESLITEQNKILAELSGVMKEHLKVSREILARLPKQIQKSDEHIIPKTSETRPAEQKESGKKTSMEKPADIMIGS